jgi:hypothetical protein
VDEIPLAAMIRTIKMIFCDNEHGTGDITFPDLFAEREELREEFLEPRTVVELRRAAKKAGWGRINGGDYCPLCMENEQTEFE